MSIFYSLEASLQLQATLNGRGLHESVNTRKLGSLRAILEAAYHISYIEIPLKLDLLIVI